MLKTVSVIYQIGRYECMSIVVVVEINVSGRHMLYIVHGPHLSILVSHMVKQSSSRFFKGEKD